jgi:hypothetical protein
VAREIGDRIWATPTHIWGINAFQSSTRPYTCRRAVVTLQPPASFHVSTHVRKHDGRTPSGTILYLQEATAVSHTTTPSVKAFPNLLIREAVPFNVHIEGFGAVATLSDVLFGILPRRIRADFVPVNYGCGFGCSAVPRAVADRFRQAAAPDFTTAFLSGCSGTCQSFLSSSFFRTSTLSIF